MATTSKNYPFEVRFAVSEEMYEWLMSVSSRQSRSVGLHVRDLVAQEMGRVDRQMMVRSTDPLIERMCPLVESIAEKLGIEIPDSGSENSAEKEG